VTDQDRPPLPNERENGGSATPEATSRTVA
jgi:hypothetical protein